MRLLYQPLESLNSESDPLDEQAAGIQKVDAPVLLFLNARH